VKKVLRNMANLADKIALVTGASRGMGRATALAVAATRAPLALNADGKPLTFDFTEVIPLPSFSLRLGFRDAGIDRNVHNA
jgi:NAD(P)-dependent dehydrogenase (short-subunit alcohol dehydrogenase family)